MSRYSLTEKEAQDQVEDLAHEIATVASHQVAVIRAKLDRVSQCNEVLSYVIDELASMVPGRRVPLSDDWAFNNIYSPIADSIMGDDFLEGIWVDEGERVGDSEDIARQVVRNAFGIPEGEGRC